MASNIHIETENLPLNCSAGIYDKIMDGIQDLLLILDADGRVLYASSISVSFIQVDPEAIIGRHLCTFMNLDDISVFLADFKENMATGGSWRYHHRLRRRDDTFAPFESTFKPYTENSGSNQAGLESTKMCLMIARPYENRCTSLMDSFLDHCTTYVRLSNQLEKLKREAQKFCQSTTTATAAWVQNGNTIQCATLPVDTTTVSGCGISKT